MVDRHGCRMRSVENDRRKERIEEQCLITLAFKANRDPRWIESNPHFLHGHAGSRFRDSPMCRGAVTPCSSLKEFS